MALHKDPSQLSKEEVISSLNVDPLKGLSYQEVLIRLELFGLNRLKEKKTIPLKIFYFLKSKTQLFGF